MKSRGEGGKSTGNKEEERESPVGKSDVESSPSRIEGRYDGGNPSVLGKASLRYECITISCVMGRKRACNLKTMLLIASHAIPNRPDQPPSFLTEGTRFTMR